MSVVTALRRGSIARKEWTFFEGKWVISTEVTCVSTASRRRTHNVRKGAVARRCAIDEEAACGSGGRRKCRIVRSAERGSDCKVSSGAGLRRRRFGEGVGREGGGWSESISMG